MQTFSDQYYNTHQKSILSNTVTKNDIYDNYSYTSCVNWEIEKPSETPSKKAFYIDNPKTGLKKTDFNIINNNDEINDMNDDTSKYSNNDLLDDMYSNTAHYHTNQEQTTNHNLYTIADNKLRSSYDLEYLDWDITDNYKGELIITYINKMGNKILCPRKFYTLYVKSNQEGNSNIVYSIDENHIFNLFLSNFCN